MSVDVLDRLVFTEDRLHLDALDQVLKGFHCFPKVFLSAVNIIIEASTDLFEGVESVE